MRPLSSAIQLSKTPLICVFLLTFSGCASEKPPGASQDRRALSRGETVTSECEVTLAARKAVRDLLCESDFAHYNFFAPIHENPRGRTCQDRLNGFASNFGRNTGEWFQNIKSCGLDEYAIKVYKTYIDIVKVYDAMAKFAQLDVSFIDKYEQGFSEGIAGPKYRSQRTSNQRPYSFMQAGRYFPQKETSCEQQREFFNSSKSETWTEDLDGDVDSMEEELFNLGLSIGGYWDLGPSGIFPENCRRR